MLIFPLTPTFSSLMRHVWSSTLATRFIRPTARMLTDWLSEKILRSLPRLCHLCGLPMNHDHHPLWCRHCLTLFDAEPRCQRCGLPTLTVIPQCGQCLKSPPPWQRLYCLTPYRFPASHYVNQIKHQRKFWYCASLAPLLIQRIDHPAPLLLSVPMHWRRQWQRGFNQSDVLAAQLARRLNRPFLAHAFTRLLHTPPQQGLNKQQRQRNLAGAFRLNRSALPHVIPKHVAIVDDVVTTGCTVRQLCQLLLAVGVESIDIYCLCRTPEKD
ncbi:ComF family protein [Vibrio vulnificus]|nr:ComF family protein [Vibrio vulnificus]RZQ73572.1 ComF family protein [Vibrio vulnificus]RZQ98650.1 ComF family protein [Vibrio vulnificus]RZR49987.1 ComF family protein [Vibrio vulnificus]